VNIVEKMGKMSELHKTPHNSFWVSTSLSTAF